MTPPLPSALVPTPQDYPRRPPRSPRSLPPIPSTGPRPLPRNPLTHPADQPAVSPTKKGIIRPLPVRPNTAPAVIQQPAHLGLSLPLPNERGLETTATLSQPRRRSIPHLGLTIDSPISPVSLESPQSPLVFARTSAQQDSLNEIGRVMQAKRWDTTEGIRTTSRSANTSSPPQTPMFPSFPEPIFPRPSLDLTIGGATIRVPILKAVDRRAARQELARRSRLWMHEKKGKRYVEQDIARVRDTLRKL